VPFKALELAAKHPLTDQGAESFLQDWQALREEQVTEETNGTSGRGV
jgi:hypothetical protein